MPDPRDPPRADLCFGSLTEAKVAAAAARRKIERANRKAERDWRPNSYGIQVVPAYRIIDTRRRPCHYYPGTTEDAQSWDKYRSNYTDPVAPSWCGPKGKPPC